MRGYLRGTEPLLNARFAHGFFYNFFNSKFSFILKQNLKCLLQPFDKKVVICKTET